MNVLVRNKKLVSFILCFMLVFSIVAMDTVECHAILPALVVGGEVVAGMAESQAVKVALQGLGMYMLGSSNMVQRILNITGIGNGWGIGQTAAGEYGLSIPQTQLNQIYQEVLREVGGYGVTSYTSSIIDSTYTDYSNWFTDSFPTYTYTNPVSMYNSITTQPYKMWTWETSDNYNAVYTSATKFTITGSGSSAVVHGTNMYRYLYRGNSLDSQGAWSGGEVGLYNSSGGKISYMNCKYGTTAIPSSMWNQNYIKPTEVNYNTWVAQPNGNVVVKIPTTLVSGVPTLDVAALPTTTVPEARINEQLIPVTEPAPETTAWPYSIPAIDAIANTLENLSYKITQFLTPTSPLSLDGTLDGYTDLFIERTGLTAFTQTENAIKNMSTGYGSPPQITINLHKLAGTASHVGSFNNNFADADVLAIDFSILERPDLTFFGMTMIQLIRTMITLAMVYATYQHVRNKIIPDKVIQ